jgi:hypothetical protein
MRKTAPLITQPIGTTAASTTKRHRAMRSLPVPFGTSKAMAIAVNCRI